MKRFQLLVAIATLVVSVPNSSYAHRYFDSWSARWTTPDPALNEGEPQFQIKKYGYKLFEESPYGYCSENPLKLVDPNGKQGNLSLGGPILLPTSWKQFVYNAVATVSAGAVTAGMVYAPTLTASLVGTILGNPATTSAVSTAVVQSLMPGTEGIGINVGTADFAVIGPYELADGGKSYIDVAKELGASYFSVGKEEAEQLGGKAVEEANYGFLDWGAKNGMEFKLSTSLENIGPKSTTQEEINYLQKQYGYTWNKDKTALMAPQQ